MTEKRAKWRLAPDDLPEDLRYEGEFLVRPSSGEAVRTLRECELVMLSGYPGCGYLNSVRSLYAVVMMLNAPLVASRTRDQSVALSCHVECRVCSAQTLLSLASCHSSTVVSLWRNLEALKGGGTSISWRAELLDTVGRNAGRAPRASTIRNTAGSRA